jgi:N-methylhydantoinase B/oxoprolinase/acetone carboxylase alpha subunit
VRIAERRILETVAKYGSATLDATFAWIIATSETRARAVIEALPDSDYSASDIIDGDVLRGSLVLSLSPQAMASFFDMLHLGQLF